MALTYPLALAAFADLLPHKSVALSLRRFDEASGSGDGRIWTASLARPLWQAEVILEAVSLPKAEIYAALLDSLDGSRGSFLWSDPSYYGPRQGDPGAEITVAGLSSDRTGLALAGLPERFQIAIGDRLSIASSAGQRYYGRFTEAQEANEEGEIALAAVSPYLPLWVAIDDEVEMRRPVMKMMIPPGGYTSFSVTRANKGEGASIRMLQRP